MSARDPPNLRRCTRSLTAVTLCTRKDVLNNVFLCNSVSVVRLCFVLLALMVLSVIGATIVRECHYSATIDVSMAMYRHVDLLHGKLSAI